MAKHVHAELIKAWADGAEIEFLNTFSTEPSWKEASHPCWTLDTKYRVKPRPKPDHVYYGVFERKGSVLLRSCFTKVNDDGDELKLTFDGETGKLKSAEIL
jgi:hypothetical protein